MQIKTRQKQLHDVLHIIATHPNAQSCISLILRVAQQAANGASVSLVSFADPHLSAGNPLDFDLDIETVERLDAMAIDSASAALLCPLRDGNDLFGALVLGTTTLPSGAKRDLLDALLDALVIVLQRERSHRAADRMKKVSDSLINSVSDPLLMFDDGWHLMFFNPAAGLIFNTETGKTLTQTLESPELVAFAQGRQGLSEWGSGEKTFIPHVQPIGDDPIIGWILVLRDITQFKKLNHSQAEFIRIVSHDIRSPLTSMRGFAEMMGMVGPLNDKQSQFSDKVQSGIAQITALVDNIQDAGRFDPETGFYEMSRSQVDLREMVKRVVGNQLIPQEKPDLTISVSVSDDVPIINADANMVERAVTNLVDNAIKYTPNGGHIDVMAYMNAGSVVVSVRDNGLGISKENQKQLFQRHVRLARPEHKRIKGTGLGLFIVKSVAQRHGGDAWVESAENVGSTFSFSIPLKGANRVIVDTTGD